MMIIFYVSLFFGGMFFVNGLPHFIMGICGKKFPTPFAKPPGRGESSSMTNMLWGTVNLIVAYMLLVQIGVWNMHFLIPSFAVGAGGFIMALFLSRHFGQVYSGTQE